MRMWPLGPDVFEDCQAVAELPSIEEGSWAPLFEPTEFNDTHGPLLLEDYQLEHDELRKWAERTVKIRAMIAEKAKTYSQTEADIEVAVDQSE